VSKRCCRVGCDVEGLSLVFECSIRGFFEAQKFVVRAHVCWRFEHHELGVHWTLGVWHVPHSW